MKRYKSLMKIFPVLMMAAGLAVSCSDWRETESLDLSFDRIQDEDSEVYQAYLANLRQYRKSDHQLMVGWFDNSQGKIQYMSRGHHLISVPDSMDMVVLTSPDDLDDTVIKEMKKLRDDKGILTLYEIDCIAADRAITRTIDQEVREGVTEDTEARYLELFESWITAQLALLTKYNYDGLSLYYNGYVLTQLVTPEMEARMRATQEILFSRLATVSSANPDKVYLYVGFAQNVVDATPAMYAMFDYYVLMMTTADNPGKADVLLYEMMENPNVPVDRIIPMVQTFSIDMDAKTGVFRDNEFNRLSAVVEMGYWRPANPAVGKAGIGVYNIQRDYYNQELEYRYIREAIAVMNPVPFN